jgi:hypothetical protein
LTLGLSPAFSDDRAKIPLANVYKLCLLNKTSKRSNKLRDRSAGLVFMTG